MNAYLVRSANDCRMNTCDCNNNMLQVLYRLFKLHESLYYLFKLFVVSPIRQLRFYISLIKPFVYVLLIFVVT